MAKKKFTLKLGPFSFVFWPEISTSLRDPLGCSDLSQIFFGSSLIATEWDKIVAEIIHKTFVFLRHLREGGWSTSIWIMSLNTLFFWVLPLRDHPKLSFCFPDLILSQTKDDIRTGGLKWPKKDDVIYVQSLRGQLMTATTKLSF